MAAKTRTTSVKGFYEHETGQITEITKDGDHVVYRLDDLLKEYDGYEVKITITEKQSIKAD